METRVVTPIHLEDAETRGEVLRTSESTVASERPEPPAGVVPPALVRIPKERYVSPDFAKLEWDRMWRHVWLNACWLGDLVKPGDFCVYEIGTESILIVRDDAGEVRAYHNVCLHRGNLLRRSRRGHTKTLRCGYHQWEWSLDGTLRCISDRPCFPADLDPAKLSLREVRCETFAGFAWINLEPNAIPLLEYLGGWAERLRPYRLEEAVLVQDLTLEVECNWKTFIDNANETYHIHSIHPQLVELLDDWDVSPVLEGRHSSFTVHFGRPSFRYRKSEMGPGLTDMLHRVGVDPEPFRTDPHAARPALLAGKRRVMRANGTDRPELTDDQLLDNFLCHLFPNTMFNIVLPGYWLFRVRPNVADPNRAYFDFQEYRLLGEGEPRPPRPEHHVAKTTDVDLDRVLTQDTLMTPLVQRGLRSSGIEEILLGGQEGRIAHMHEVLMRYLAGEGGAGGEPGGAAR